MNVQTAVFSLPVRRGRGGPGERSWRAVAACFWGPPLGTHAQTACPEGPLDPGCSAGQSHTSLSPADSVTEAQRGDRAGCHGAARGQAPAPRPCPVGATGGVGDGAGPQEASRALASCLHQPPGLLSQRASAAWSHRRLRKRQRSARQTPQGHWKRVPRGHVQRQAAGTRRRGGLLRQPRRVGPCPSPASHGLATGRCSPRLGPPVTVHGPRQRAWGLQPSERRTRCKTEAQPGGPAGRMAWAPREELWGAGPPGSRATRTRPPPSPLPSSEGAEHWEGSRGQAPAASWEHEPSPLSGLLPASPLKYAGAQGIASLEGSHFCKTEEVVAQLKTRPLRAFSKPVPMRARLVRAGWGSQGSPRGTASPVMSRDWATSLAISCQRAG